jgi:alpha-L-arabinofuranosidase
MLMGANGRMLAMQTIKNIHNEDWKQYRCVLKAVGGDTAASFHLAFDQPGTVWLDMVSLFPAETFRGRPNGLRKDLAEYIAALKPAFVRWPGGCFVEGIDIQSAPDWRTTIGPVEGRTGTYSPWGYWSSDGFGYHEYLQFCEDIGAAALYVCNAGVSCDFRSGTFVPDDSVSEYVQRALDAIEYAIGPVDSKWGRIRAASGHPRPFPLKYIEIGNEQSGPRYAKRFNQFYTAIKARYPGIEVIAAMGIGDVNRHTLDSMRKLDIADEHAYKAAYWAMGHYDHFDKYHRGDWDLYVGEYATNSGVGKGNMEAALSDAVYIMSMEKNGDLVKMSSYAPMLVNVHDEDWPVNLIHFDAARSFGRISYYAVKMLSAARADVNLPVQTQLMAAPRRGPAFAGGIGLGTWDTQAEYKDIEVSQEGKVVYRSDLAGGVGGWSFVRGQWSLRDSALAQTGEGAQHLAILNGRSFDTYTLRLRARKLGGYNAFIIPFAVKDTNTCYRAHIGSWWNSHCTIEKLTNGYDVTDLIEQQKLKRPIETGRWYDIRLEVGKDTVKCWLDDELVMVYREPVKVFALAGRKGDDLIIKVVNAAGLPCKGMLHIDGATQIGQTGELTTLSAERADAENSFADPQKYIPVVTPITGIGSDFEKLFPPYSISIIKIKAK